MGKPRLIIITRHAQSEGNKDKTIHQTTPDHKVSITPKGHQQARAAGEKLRALLRPDDSLHFFISPYKRTRQTTEGILSTLCSNDPDPSPFQRNHIKVYEEPRLREQDFGNFQPNAEEVERLWRERADYGHFFYRIPNGESGADVYDRITSFNGSLWRRFGDDDMASVAVLVTHGLCSRVFLMAWYHYSVEFFEDLRNINHCEFLVMKLGSNGRYVLQNQLRLWSDLRRERAALRSSSNLTQAQDASIPAIPVRRWASRRSAYDATGSTFTARRPARQNTADLFRDDESFEGHDEEDHGYQKAAGSPIYGRPAPAEAAAAQKAVQTKPHFPTSQPTPTVPQSTAYTVGESRTDQSRIYYDFGRDGGGSCSGAASLIHSDSENEGESAADDNDDNDDDLAAIIPPETKDAAPSISTRTEVSTYHPRSLSRALRGELNGPNRVMADALGDQSDAEVEEADIEVGTKQKELFEMRQILADEKKDRSRHREYF
ncbi:hypothetical protein DV736_g4691, partial [Chaetothyriales sp. CBS 134916]